MWEFSAGWEKTQLNQVSHKNRLCMILFDIVRMSEGGREWLSKLMSGSRTCGSLEELAVHGAAVTQAAHWGETLRGEIGRRRGIFYPPH